MSLDCPLRGTEPPRLRGLPPMVGPVVRVLVLGSMPGERSLREGEYYAHPRNAFWPIVEQVLGIPRAMPYADRTAALRGAGIALWDVLAACRRHGSLDAGIERDSMELNPLPALLEASAGLRVVAFNGVLAETVFRRAFGAALQAHPAAPALVRLPSTSPANAGYSFERKLQAWREVLQWTP